MNIKKTLIALSLSTATILASSTETVDQKNPSEDIIKKIENMSFMKKRGVKILAFNEHKKDFGSIYHLRGSRVGDFYLLPDMETIIDGTNGKAYNINQSNETLEQLYIKQDLSYLKKDAQIIIGEGKKELILFSNLECSACKQLHQKLEDLDYLKEYKVYVYFLYFKRTKKSYQYLQTMLSKKMDDRIVFYKDFMEDKMQWGKSDGKPSKKIDEQILYGVKESMKIGAYGTPSFFELDGKPVNIGLIIEELTNKRKAIK